MAIEQPASAANVATAAAAASRLGQLGGYPALYRRPAIGCIYMTTSDGAASFGTRRPRMQQQDKNVNQLRIDEFADSRDPFTLFDQWMTRAEASELNDPNVM